MDVVSKTNLLILAGSAVGIVSGVTLRWLGRITEDRQLILGLIFFATLTSITWQFGPENSWRAGVCAIFGFLAGVILVRPRKR